MFQMCPTVCDPIDWSLPGSSVHGFFPARILKRVAIPSSRGSLWPRNRTGVSCVSCISGRFFTAGSCGSPLPLHGKMKTSGLVEIAPLTCTSAVCGRYPVLSHPESPHGVRVGGCRGLCLAGGHPVSSWVPPGLTRAAAMWCLAGGHPVSSWVPPGLTRAAATWWLDGCKVFVYWHGRQHFFSLTSNWLL